MKLVEFYTRINETATEDFQQYIRDKYGIVFDLREIKPGIIDIESMQNTKRVPGIGTMIMNELITWADNNNKMLTLGLAEKGYQPAGTGPKTSSSNRLAKFYSRFGFIRNKGRNKRFELSVNANMYRDPSGRKDEPELELEAGITDSHSGESFGYVKATLGDQTVGVINFSHFEDKGYVNWIKTADGYGRKGIATKMVEYLRKWLEAPIEFTSTTDDGTGLGKYLRTKGMIEGTIMEERILQAAFIDPATNTVYPVGGRHLIQPLMAHGVPMDTMERLVAEPNQGFVTDHGRWLDRRAASKLVNFPEEELDSRDIPGVSQKQFDINEPHNFKLAWQILDMPEGDNDES